MQRLELRRGAAIIPDPDAAHARRAWSGARQSASALRSFIKARLRVTGHLFQSHFASVLMDEAHRMVAARYVALNPVRARLVERERTGVNLENKLARRSGSRPSLHSYDGRRGSARAA